MHFRSPPPLVAGLGYRASGIRIPAPAVSVKQIPSFRRRKNIADKVDRREYVEQTTITALATSETQTTRIPIRTECTWLVDRGPGIACGAKEGSETCHHIERAGRYLTSRERTQSSGMTNFAGSSQSSY